MGQPSQPSAPGRPAAHEPVSRTGETVTVGCKLPLGIQMQVFVMEDVEETTSGGQIRRYKRARAVGEPIKLNGSARYRGSDHETTHRIEHGAGLTFGVPKDAWERWRDANRDNDFIRKGHVFAHGSDAPGVAAERAAIKTGLEPVDPRAKVIDPDTRGIIEQAA